MIARIPEQLAIVGRYIVATTANTRLWAEDFIDRHEANNRHEIIKSAAVDAAGRAHYIKPARGCRQWIRVTDGCWILPMTRQYVLEVTKNRTFDASDNREEITTKGITRVNRPYFYSVHPVTPNGEIDRRRQCYASSILGSGYSAGRILENVMESRVFG